MKIHWNQNPLLTRVEVDQSDRERILLYIQNEEYVNILCELDMFFKGKLNLKYTEEEIKTKVSEWGSICNLEADCEEVDDYVHALQHIHIGDCTCIAASCYKCRAEKALGVDTIKGLSKHQGSVILSAYQDGRTTIDEALEYINQPLTYENRHSSYKDYSERRYMPLTLRWSIDRKEVAKWLQNYKEEHGF